MEKNLWFLYRGVLCGPAKKARQSRHDGIKCHAELGQAGFFLHLTWFVQSHVFFFFFFFFFRVSLFGVVFVWF